jgi:outer membrane protein OmpA-like peptidoglycan-associated protein
MVDVIVPGLYPFEGVAITGEGGAADSGLAVAGKSAELTQVIKDLGADDTPKAVKVNLAADLLFDFDKADINPGAEPQLAKVVTLLKAYSTADVVIDGHTDGKGGDAYNQMLSEKRAAAVAQWLAAHAGIDSAKLRTRGWGKTKPVAANTNSDGSDNPEGRAKNRRVEITISKS